jgi:hypothetical protein
MTEPGTDTTNKSEMDWGSTLLEQLTWHWEAQLRPRLAGLTDEEYFWEPVPGCWSLRAQGTSAAPAQVGGGEMRLDFGHPAPVPAPVTTIAWRLGHIIVGVLGQRNAAHFDGPPCAYATYDYPATADDALARLDEEYARWVAGVKGLGGIDVPGEGLLRLCGPAEGPYAEFTLAQLVFHINREVIHHGAEIALLRDLYVHRTVA